MIERLAILGATGDLTMRYLLPALGVLLAQRLLPHSLSILAVGRDDLDTEQYRTLASDGLVRGGTLAGAARDEILGRLRYRVADVTDREALAAALAPVTTPTLIYLALPPAVMAATVDALAGAGVGAASAIVVEKPVGADLASARDLNARLRRALPDARVFRIDHVLGMQMVQALLGLRFANRLVEAVWNREHVARCEIIWDETLALEGRAGYYDSIGALRDMVQNHLLQVLCLVAMEPPAAVAVGPLHDRKLEVLQAIAPYRSTEVARWTRRGRYTAGRIGDRAIPSYVDEPDVDPTRQTETFAEVTLFIATPRWEGVPFLLRSGKALAEDRIEVRLVFRPNESRLFGVTEPNVLCLTMEPDAFALHLALSGGRELTALRPHRLDGSLPAPALPPYARLLLDVFAGDQTLFVSADEVEAAWRIIDPIVAGWRAGAVPLLDYPAGSVGPA
jgi:glucose-6-phosphate 1-dehydrogenase